MSRESEKPASGGKTPELGSSWGLGVVAYETYREIESQGAGHLDSNMFGGPGKVMKGKLLILVPMSQEEFNGMKALSGYEQRMIYIARIGSTREVLQVEVSADPGLSDRPVVGLVKVPVKVIGKIAPQKPE